MTVDRQVHSANDGEDVIPFKVQICCVLKFVLLRIYVGLTALCSLCVAAHWFGIGAGRWGLRTVV